MPRCDESGRRGHSGTRSRRAGALGLGVALGLILFMPGVASGHANDVTYSTCNSGFRDNTVYYTNYIRNYRLQGDIYDCGFAVGCETLYYSKIDNVGDAMTDDHKTSCGGYDEWFHGDEVAHSLCRFVTISGFAPDRQPLFCLYHRL